MLSFEEARKRLLSLAPRLGAERVVLDDAVGRVLATPLVAGASLPPFDASAMDGYAVCASELSEAGPWRLPVSGESRAGGALATLEPGTARRIFTGAVLPEGADTVVMQERTRAGDGLVQLEERPRPGAHVRRRGEDIARGAVAVEPGTRLGPAHVGLASALGAARLEVVRRPVVSIVCIGDELRDAGELTDGPAIYESNGTALSALARQAGASVRLAPIQRDRVEPMRDAFSAELALCDVLVTVGGVSVGEHDLARPALEQAGVSLDFWKVDIKPGKPVAVGRRDRTIVLALPGNPAAAYVTFVLFGMPLLRALQGDARAVPPLVRLPLVEPLSRKGGRTELMRARVEAEGGFARVRIHPKQSSAAFSSLAWSDALAFAPADRASFEAGDLLDVLRLCDA